MKVKEDVLCKDKYQCSYIWISFLVLLSLVLGSCPPEEGGGGGGQVNCCQFRDPDSCEDLTGGGCTNQGGVLVENATCSSDVGLCIGIEPTPTPFPPCPTPNPDCGSPNFDAFDGTVVTFCEDDPESGGLLAEVIVVQDGEARIAVIATRIPPNLQESVGGPGTVFLMCPVTGPKVCDPTQGTVTIILDSGGELLFPVLEGMVFLEDNAFDNAFLNLVDVLTNATEIEPLNFLGGCVDVEGLPAAQAKDLLIILEEKMIEYGLEGGDNEQ